LLRKRIQAFEKESENSWKYLQELSVVQDHNPTLSPKDDTETTVLKPSTRRVVIRDALLHEWHNVNR
jgi:hypothetical protein